MSRTSSVASIDRTPADLSLARARAGDLDAFEELYRRHVGRVHALCLRLTADPARAEELTQETFVRAWRGLGSFRGEAGLSAWLSRIAVNVVRSAWRSAEGRAERNERSLPPEVAPTVAGAEPRIAALDLERAIAGLPAGAREVFVLYDVEGLRHEEVAGRLEVSVGTSKSQLHRARRLLREALSR